MSNKIDSFHASNKPAPTKAYFNDTTGDHRQSSLFAVNAEEGPKSIPNALKITITKGLKPEHPGFDAEQVTKEEVLDEYSGPINLSLTPGRICLNLTSAGDLV